MLLLVSWWFLCESRLLIVTNKKTILRKGVLFTQTSEVFLMDVRNVQVRQDLFLRMLGLGKVGIVGADQAGVES